jgi:hypothetical protein
MPRRFSAAFIFTPRHSVDKTRRSFKEKIVAWIDINEYQFPQGWTQPESAEQLAKNRCEQLERGGILFFKTPPFDLPEADRQFLLGQRQSGFKGHKNISYRPLTNELRGAAAGESPEDAGRLTDIMKRYSQQVTGFVDRFLLPYAKHRVLDFASYRPIEEQNRDLPLHKRNDLAHVDAFPTRPTNGGRILRVFTNINPVENRVWETTDPFDVIAPKFAADAGLEELTAPTAMRRVVSGLAPILKTVVKGVDRSPYDRFMLRFHDYLKENQEYQTKYPKVRTEFPPNSAWLVYTDTVPHAVLSGKFALEQTFIIPVKAMVAPSTAPIKVLESLVGRGLSN